MMGRQRGDPSQLFYLFNLERRIPTGHLLRRINPVVTGVLSYLHEKLAPFYSEIGRPSIDPELMIRMLIVGTATASASSGGCVRKSSCIWPTDGSAGSISTIRCLITRHSRSTAMAVSATATFYGRYSRR